MGQSLQTNRIKMKIGFMFSTKDRTEFTLQSLKGIDAEGGFDLIWIDGSKTQRGKELLGQIELHNCHFAEIHHDIVGGSTKAIILGLSRLLSLGYDYCGIIENDIGFKQGWFSKLMELFDMGDRDRLEVGAATIRTIASRVLAYKPDYAVMYNVGAGMVLFTAKAAKIVLDNIYYSIEKGFKINAQLLKKFYKEKYGVDLTTVYEVWMEKPNRSLGYDWAYAMELDKCNLSSLGSIPFMAYNLDCNMAKYHTCYVGGVE